MQQPEAMFTPVHLLRRFWIVVEIRLEWSNTACFIADNEEPFE